MAVRYAAVTESLRTENAEGSRMDPVELLRSHATTAMRDGAALGGPEALVQYGGQAAQRQDVAKIIQELNKAKRGLLRPRNEEEKQIESAATREGLDDNKSYPSGFEDPLDVPVAGPIGKAPLGVSSLAGAQELNAYPGGAYGHCQSFDQLHQSFSQDDDEPHRLSLSSPYRRGRAETASDAVSDFDRRGAGQQASLQPTHAVIEDNYSDRL